MTTGPLAAKASEPGSLAEPVGDLSRRAFDHIGRGPHPAVQGARRHPFGCRGPEPHGAFTAAHMGEAFALSARSPDDTSEPLHAQHRRRLGLPQEGRGAANILPTCPMSWHGSPRPWVDLGACSPTPAGASDRHSNSVWGTIFAFSSATCHGRRGTRCGYAFPHSSSALMPSCSSTSRRP